MAICRNVAHEFTVYLQCADWKTFQVGQRGIACSEVINGDRQSHFPELLQSLYGRLNIFHDNSLGDF